MHSVFVTAFLLAICFSSLGVLAVHRSERDSGFTRVENFAEENDALDDREIKENSDSDAFLDFDGDDDKRNVDDLFFLQESDDKPGKRESVDYSEWRKNGFKLNDEKIEEEEKEEVEEEKGMVKKLIQKFKNLLHKLGKRK